MRSLILLAVICVAVSVAWPMHQMKVHQQKAAERLHDKLHVKLSANSADYTKLPPLEQRQVIHALHQMLLARATQTLGKDGKLTELNLNATGAGLPCFICERAVKWLVDHANDWACDAGFDAIATLACQAAGLGPEDPWSDICTGAMIAGCHIILEKIEEHVHSTKTICKAIHLC